MTLNGEMAPTLRHFTEFGSGPYFAFRIHVRCRRKTIVRLTLVSKSTVLLIVYDYINTICAISQRLFKQNKLR